MARLKNRTRHLRLDPVLDAKLEVLCQSTSRNASEVIQLLLERACMDMGSTIHRGRGNEPRK
jgi:hypothetical protein